MINSITDKRIIEGIEESWYEVWKMLTKTPWGRLEEDEYMSKVYTGLYADGVLRARLTHDLVDVKIEEAIKYFESSQRWIWPVYSSTTPKDVGQSLVNYGFSKVEEEHPCMAVNLNELEKDTHHPENLEIRKVKDESALDVWSRVFLVGHGLERLLESGMRLFKAVGLRDGSAVKYLGYYDEVPVASSQVYLGKSVARLNFVSTLPEARGKGIGTEISKTALLDARDHGCKVAVLTATDMGYPIYCKLGFKEICNWDYYVYDK